MEEVEQFIYNLKSSNIVKPIRFKENHINALSNFAKALVFIIPAAYFFYKFFYKKKVIKFNNLQEISDNENKKNRNKNIMSIIQGVIFIILGYRLWFHFVPNNSQISLGLLIKYLSKRRIIEPEFYNIIKKFRPSNIDKYVP